MFIFSCFSFCCDKADPASTLNLSVTACWSAAVSGLRVRFINLEMV